MANKSRPKKTRGLRYRKYVYGVNPDKDDDDDEEEEEEPEVDTEALGSLSVDNTTNDDLSIVKSRRDHYKLPLELIFKIISDNLEVKPKFLRINRSLFYMLAPLVYADPFLSSHNFFQFVDTLSASSKKKFYGSLIKSLNLSNIVQSGKNSFISRLLRRSAPTLEAFVAPQTSFGYSPLVSLRACHKLKTLDLGLVSETVNLSELFVSMKNCPDLEKLSFPRSSVECRNYEDIKWPESLKHLRLSGGISKEFLETISFPKTIRALELAHCPFISSESVYILLSKIGKSLKSFIIHYPMPKLKDDSMDMLLMYCPNLKFLYVSVDYVTGGLLSEDFFDVHPLLTLWIDSSGSLGQSFKIHPDDITIALAEDRLPNLKNLKITHKLGWNTESNDIQDMIGVLEEQGGALYVDA